MESGQPLPPFVEPYPGGRLTTQQPSEVLLVANMLGGGHTHPFDFHLKGQGRVWRNAFRFCQRPASQCWWDEEEPPTSSLHANYRIFPALQVPEMENQAENKFG